jgi:hypothetical protein
MTICIKMPYKLEYGLITDESAKKKTEILDWCSKVFGAIVCEPSPGAPSVLRIAVGKTRWHYGEYREGSWPKHIAGINFWFRLESDATLFKLTWG